MSTLSEDDASLNEQITKFWQFEDTSIIQGYSEEEKNTSNILIEP